VLNNILAESLFAISVILGFGVYGVSLLLPFADTSRFWILAAPFAGMLIVPVGANAFYSVFDIPYRRAAVIAAICCVIAGILRVACRSCAMVVAGGARARRPAVCSLPRCDRIIPVTLDYGHIGFFGKLLNYPPVLMVAGLAPKGFSRARSLHHGIGCRSRNRPRRRSHVAAMRQHTGGSIGRTSCHRARSDPAPFEGAQVWRCLASPNNCKRDTRLATISDFSDWKLTWLYQLPRMFDLEHQFGVIRLASNDLLIMTAIALLIWARLLLAVWRRSISAIGLIAGRAMC
jgi:hypothetical protein